MTTGIADRDRISFAAGKGLSAGFLVSGVIILALAAMVGGVMISQDTWEREVGLALAFLAGVGVISSVVGLAPLFMGRRVVDFKGGEIRTPTGRCPLWQVRSVTVSSRMWTVPLSGFQGGRSSVASGSPTEVQMYELGVVTSEVELDATGVSEQLRTERLTSGHHIGLSGLLLTIACFVLIALVVGGHHRKTLRVGPSGIERSTDVRWSRAATIPLPDIIDVQTITVTRRAGRSTTTEYSVDIIGENRSIRHACDDEDAASWIQQQARDAISYLRATPFEPAPG